MSNEYEWKDLETNTAKYLFEVEKPLNRFTYIIIRLSIFILRLLGESVVSYQERLNNLWTKKEGSIAEETDTHFEEFVERFRRSMATTLPDSQPRLEEPTAIETELKQATEKLRKRVESITDPKYLGDYNDWLLGTRPVYQARDKALCRESELSNILLSQVTEGLRTSLLTLGLVCTDISLTCKVGQSFDDRKINVAIGGRVFLQGIAQTRLNTHVVSFLHPSTQLGSCYSLNNLFPEIIIDNLTKRLVEKLVKIIIDDNINM